MRAKLRPGRANLRSTRRETEGPMDGVLGGLGGWWDFWLVVGEFDAQ